LRRLKGPAAIIALLAILHIFFSANPRTANFQILAPLAQNYLFYLPGLLGFLIHVFARFYGLEAAQANRPSVKSSVLHASKLFCQSSS